MTKPVVILVALSGCSSSGKTTIAKLTSKALKSATLLHEDDFYKHDAEIPFNEEFQVADWDCPEALDLDLFKRTLKEIKQTGCIATKLIQNNNVDDIKKFKLDEKQWNLLLQKYSAIDEKKVKVVIVDGFMIYHDNTLKNMFDVRILVRAPYNVLKNRRSARDGYQTLDSYWVDPPFYFDEFVYSSYVQEHKHLFEEENVEGKLRSDANLVELLNDDELDMNEALNFVADQIIESLK